MPRTDFQFVLITVALVGVAVAIVLLPGKPAGRLHEELERSQPRDVTTPPNFLLERRQLVEDARGYVRQGADVA